MSLDVNAKILFVDDEINILEAVKRQLRGRFSVETALNAEGGFEKIGQCGPFDVVVSDLRMDGMDGMEFVREVRKMTPDTVCVILTGCADLDAAVEAVNERKIYRFLTKPCPTEQLVETLEECIRRHNEMLGKSSYTYTTYIEDGKFVWTDRSEGCFAVTGYQPQDFIDTGELWHSIIVPEFRETISLRNEKILAGAEPGPVEIRIRKKDGTERWIRETVITHNAPQKKPVRFDCYVEDITEKKEVECALQKSEARYQRMVANSPGLVFQMRQKAEGKMEFVFLSESCRQLFGFGPEELMNDPDIFFDRIQNDDRRELEKLVADSAVGLSALEWWGRWSGDEGEKWFQCVARPERIDDSATLWDGMLIDVTELRRAEKQIRELAKFPSENPNPVLRANSGGTIIYANKASGSLLSRWKLSVGDKLPDNIRSHAAEVMKKGSHDCLEVQCEDRVFSIVFSPITEGGYINLYARDVSKEKLAELELRRANEVLKEHDRLKSEFVSTVTHELRTPLCIFKNIMSNALAGVFGEINGKLKDNLVMADHSVDRLSRIISDFLDISKIESGTMKLGLRFVTLQGVIDEVVENITSLAAERKIKIKKHYPKNDVVVTADQDRVIQVLTNLVGNAVKFINEGGKIDIELEQFDDEAVITVGDDGPGLDSEQLEKVFDRFVQMKILKGPGHHGTGLGLTIAKQLVEMHGGRLWVDSVSGQGCNFHFSLPKSPNSDLSSTLNKGKNNSGNDEDHGNRDDKNGDKNSQN